MIATVRRVARNVKRWHNGDMCLRWTAAGMLEAETQFRRVIGHTDLAITVERDLAVRHAADTPDHDPSDDHRDRGAGGHRFTRLRSFTQAIAVPRFHGERDILSGRGERLAGPDGAGRQESWEEPAGRSDGEFMHWVRRHDEYEGARAGA